jgi:hypothetical protein
MAKLTFKGSYKKGPENFETQLSLIAFEEDGVTIIYSPALDLSGSGYDLNQAKASFWETLSEFLRYASNKKTLAPELKRLVWNIRKGKISKKITAPDFASMMKNNKEFEDIVSNKDFRKFDETIEIPVFA